MHGSIFPVTIPTGTPRDKSSPSGFFKAVLSRGRGRGKLKLASPCFCEVRHSSRGWHDGGGPRDCLFSREKAGIFRKVVGQE